MTDDAQRVRVEELDWHNLLPFLQIFRSFRMAIHPMKLLTALLLVVLIYLFGIFLDTVLPPTVYPGEIEAYAQRQGQDFDEWREAQAASVGSHVDRQVGVIKGIASDFDVRGDERVRLAMERADADDAGYDDALVLLQQVFAAERRQRIEAVRSAEDQQGDGAREALAALRFEEQRALARLETGRPRGVFESVMAWTLGSFQRLITSSLALEFGPEALLPTREYRHDTIFGALRDMTVTLPTWLFQAHPLQAAAHTIIGLLLWSLLGGTIARMAAVHAIVGRQPGLEALLYAWRHWVWFIVAPLIPLLLAACIALALSVLGMVFFGIPYVRAVFGIIGGLGFGLMLGLGFIAAIIMIGLAIAIHLLYPAIAVEGTDGFDANSRAFSYVVARIWHLLFYNLVGLLYLAATYLFVGGLIFVTLLLTQYFIASGSGVFVETETGVARFSLVLPPPELGQLAYTPQWSQLSVSETISAVLIMVWVYLLVGLGAAYAISFYVSAQTWIYLLLRRSADGTEFEEYAEDAPSSAAPAASPEKVEPPTGDA